jgi:hypothetical protein
MDDATKWRLRAEVSDAVADLHQAFGLGLPLSRSAQSSLDELSERARDAPMRVVITGSPGLIDGLATFIGNVCGGLHDSNGRPDPGTYLSRLSEAISLLRLARNLASDQPACRIALRTKNALGAIVEAVDGILLLAGLAAEKTPEQAGLCVSIAVQTLSNAVTGDAASAEQARGGWGMVVGAGGAEAAACCQLASSCARSPRCCMPRLRVAAPLGHGVLLDMEDRVITGSDLFRLDSH